ncbi:MAG: ATP-binding protein [Candidatus Brocadiia bacterium]
MSDRPSVVYCYCAYSEVVPRRARHGVLGRLAASGADFQAFPDLCELAARRDPVLADIASRGRVDIVACYPRAVRALFAAGGAPLPEEGVRVLNQREQDAETILRALLGEGAAEPPAEEVRGALDAARSDLLSRKGGWIPWFPLIDRDRCKGCRQCLDFCLFGVYALDDEGRVEVRQPANCKTYCPACARVCPEVAIIFPKHKKAPINGAPVTEEDERREKVQVDLSRLAKGDVHAMLRQRSERRFPADRDEQAARERRQQYLRLAELQEELDIPPEVIDALRPRPAPREESEGDETSEGTERESPQ